MRTHEKEKEKNGAQSNPCCGGSERVRQEVARGRDETKQNKNTGDRAAIDLGRIDDETQRPFVLLGKLYITCSYDKRGKRRGEETNQRREGRAVWRREWSSTGRSIS